MLWAGPPLRPNAAGTCGSPTNAPSKNAVQGFVVDSVCAVAFFHRGIIPLLTLFFSASGSQKTAVTPLEEGRQMPFGLPPLRGNQFHPPDESFSKSVPQGTPQLFTLPYSLFSFHSPRPAAYRTPANPPYFLGLPRNCSPQGRSHFLGTVPVPAACVWVWHVRRF